MHIMHSSPHVHLGVTDVINNAGVFMLGKLTYLVLLSLKVCVVRKKLCVFKVVQMLLLMLNIIVVV